MTTALLIRHARSTANTAGILAGRAAGVDLDATGREQARALGESLADVPLAAIYSSPLERCQQTAAAVCSMQRSDAQLAIATRDELTECDYGDWTGKAIAELSSEPLWATMQRSPSRVTFPAGESALDMSHRAICALYDLSAQASAEHGDDAVWALVSHGDVIKAMVAALLGMPFDTFQRLSISPASVSVVSLSSAHQVLVRYNHCGPNPFEASTGGATPAVTIGGQAS